MAEVSRPKLSRPILSAEPPPQCSSVAVPADGLGSDRLPSSSVSSRRRLPALLSCAQPRLSRQPSRWTPQLSPDGDRVVIGKGAFGRVFRATFRGRPVAVKEVGGNSPHGRQEVYSREIRGANFLLGLSHVNVVRYLQFDTSSQPGVLHVVMELIEGRNLAELRRAGPLDEGDVRSVMAQACCGLHYLHSRRPPIVHRDVKGSNIMVTSCQVVKLVDLGLAILCEHCSKAEIVEGRGLPSDSDPMRQSLVGTHRFMAPEVFECQLYSPSSDIFALGCTAFQLHCGHPPHADKSNYLAVCYAVMMQPMPDMPLVCNSRLADLYRSCTQRNPQMRPSAAEILRHSFIVGECETDSRVGP